MRCIAVCRDYWPRVAQFRLVSFLAVWVVLLPVVAKLLSPVPVIPTAWKEVIQWPAVRAVNVGAVQYDVIGCSTVNRKVHHVSELEAAWKQAGGDTAVMVRPLAAPTTNLARLLQERRTEHQHEQFLYIK